MCSSRTAGDVAYALGATHDPARRQTMHAAVLSAPGVARLERVARPAPGPGQVLIRMEGCGVCASNLTPWAGPDWMKFPTPPGDLGHEGWGTVDAVGPGVAAFAAGDRGATLSHRSYAEFDLPAPAELIRLPVELDGQPFPGEPL